MAQAGYTAAGPLNISSILVQDPNDPTKYLFSPTSLFSQVDGDTVQVAAAALANWFGSFSTLTLVLDTGIGGIVKL